MVSSTALLSVLGVAAAASAAPAVSRQAPVYPATNTANFFQLVANVTGTDLTPSIQNWVVQSYHTGAGLSVATLGNPSTSSPKSFPDFYVNGTAYDVQFGQSGVVMDLGDSSFPMAVQAAESMTDSEGRHPIEINVGEATNNVGFKSIPDPYPTAYGPGHDGESTYYACNTQLAYGPGVGLYFAYDGEAVPEGCVPVTLLPQCATGSGVVKPDQVATRCYDSVAGIDWRSSGAPW